MDTLTYLIDTNILIALEDDHTVQPAFSALISCATQHGVKIFIHAAARDDINRDKDDKRRKISLSKLEKFPVLERIRGLTNVKLEHEFGPIPRPNDVVDSTLLHTLQTGVVDFLVTEDNGLHKRARRHSNELGSRILRVADAVELLQTTFEPKNKNPIRYVDQVPAHTIPLEDPIFDSLREGYPSFDNWWTEKCVRQQRDCWIIDDQEQGLAGLIVKKDEQPGNTDATLPANKILKICTFKVCPEKRGSKLGELLLKKVFWFAQDNEYDVVYVTTYTEQETLIDLLEYYGFVNTATKDDGELIYEKPFSRAKLVRQTTVDDFETNRLNYPRFITEPDVRAFGIPIKETYHDTLYPDLKNVLQQDLFDNLGDDNTPRRPGNTIRKVYLCRAQSNLGPPGSLLFFYKGKSQNEPSQAITAVGIFESLSKASSDTELLRLTGGRSVYSEADLAGWGASIAKPVKVINFLLAAYIDPYQPLTQLQKNGIFAGHPPQSIFEIRNEKLTKLLMGIELGFST